MLDIHAPHKRIAGIKEFFVHLFTIIVGLMIATQIESFVEWRHHVYLAAEARASLHEEIEHNLQDLKDAVPGMTAWRSEVDRSMEALRRMQTDPNRHSQLSVSWHSIGLRDTAWKTAQATGALAYMPYEEAQRFTRIYKAQGDFLAGQQNPADDVARIFGSVSRYLPEDSSKLKPEQAGELLERYGQMRMHLLALDSHLKANLELNQAYIEGREPKGDFSETIH